MDSPEIAALESHSEPSELDESQDDARRSDYHARGLVGVSISRTQTQVASPGTFPGELSDATRQQKLVEVFTGRDGHDTPPEEEYTSGDAVQGRPSQARPSRDIPEVEATGGDVKSVNSHQKSPVEHGTGQSRPGAPDLNLKRFLGSLSAPKPPNLKDFSLHGLSEFLSGHKDDNNHHGRSKRSSTLLPSKAIWNNSPSPQRRPLSGRYPAHATESKPAATPPAPLRRSTSDQSFSVRRVISDSSSFGDDRRWEHVQEQVNSRLKAVKDTWQDTNIIKLPKIPSMSLAGLRPGSLRNRALSDPSRLDRKNGSESKPIGKAKHNTERPWGPQTVDIPPLNSAASKALPTPTHPKLAEALDEMTGDLVFLGGYRGSILRSATPPHRQLWVPVKVGLNIRKVDLEVGLDPEDEERMHERIISGGMLSHIGPVDMGRRLIRKARHCRNVQDGKLRIHEYGYDWRLSPHLLSRRLLDFLRKLPCNADGVPVQERGAFVVSHSLGGLITRHAVNQEPHLFAGVVYAGVPQHCINILGPLRNDDKVLLSSKVLTAQVTFSIRTTFLLLPHNRQCFINKASKEHYPVDFFDVEDWKSYCLSPCIAPALPPYQPEKKSLLDTMTNNLPSVSNPFKKVFSPEPTVRPPSHNPHYLETKDFLNPATSSRPEAPVSTIPLPLAIDYLTRTLAATLQFKHEMEFLPSLAAPQQNLYPPLAILYGTSVPTVAAAKVANRDAIKCCDAYDELQFGSGDGVCLARAAMLPRGYEYVERGKVRSEKGHVGLLGDLDGVGNCLLAVLKARREGVGLGESSRKL